MLELLNRYSHGLVLAPVVDALRQGGVMARLASGRPFDPRDPTNAHLNSGYLAAGLRMLEALGWIARERGERYVATRGMSQSARIPPDVMTLFKFDFETWLAGQAASPLAPWLERSKDRWGAGSGEAIPDYLDGLLAIPLLLALTKTGALEVRPAGGAGAARLRLSVQDDLRNEIVGFFTERGWIRPGGAEPELTRPGAAIVDRIFITAALSAYRPMLSRAAELLCGDPKVVFARTDVGGEGHLDRTLNVLGSGFQHEKYFAALDRAILRIFAGDDFASQPAYVADMGSGDGSLLARIHQVVATRTERGKQLDRHPLTLIGIDLNDEALAATSARLAGLSHLCIKGDISAPEELLRQLLVRGVSDPQRILHVRSFLDHDRTYLPPTSTAPVEAEVEDVVHIGSDGARLDPRDVLQSTVEHLERWSAAVDGHGLLMLEVHALPVDQTRAFLDQAESFHFDAYHSLSGQHLHTAAAFLACAASAGLFSRPDTLQVFPEHLSFTRISLHHFRHRPYRAWIGSSADRAAAASLQRIHQAGAGRDGGRSDGPAYLLHEGGRLQAALFSSAGTITSAYVDEGLRQDRLEALLEFATQHRFLQGAPLDEPAVEAVREAWRSRIAAPRLIDVERLPAPPDSPREAERALAAYAFQRVLALFQQAGLDVSPGSLVSLEASALRLSIAPKFAAYFRSLIHRLERAHLVAKAGDQITFLAAAPADLPGTATFQEEMRQRFPLFAPQAAFTLRCLDRLGDILTGRINAAEVMFANGSEVFGAIFAGDPIADYFNAILASAVKHAVERVEPGAPSRILEIGAGTGGATAAVLAELGPLQPSVRYTATDLSPTFVRQLQRRFQPDQALLDCEVLDIDEDLPAGSAHLGRYHVVIASNVLHDTRDIGRTLARVRSLLAPGGVLLLNEYTEVKTWLHMSGALLHGMWLFEDPERRLEHFCLLSPQLWRQALFDAGFHRVEVHGLPSEAPENEFGQCVLIAVKAGDEAARSVCPDRPAQHDAPDDAGAPVSEEPTAASGIRRVIDRAVLEILGPDRQARYADRPALADLGLDSLEMVELKLIIAEALHVQLPPAFLFEHNTVEEIEREVSDMLRARPAPPGPL